MAEKHIGQVAALANQAIGRINGRAGQQQCRNLRTKRSGDRIKYWIGKDWWAPQDSNFRPETGPSRTECYETLYWRGFEGSDRGSMQPGKNRGKEVKSGELVHKALHKIMKHTDATTDDRKSGKGNEPKDRAADQDFVKPKVRSSKPSLEMPLGEVPLEKPPVESAKAEATAGKSGAGRVSKSTGEHFVRLHLGPIPGRLKSRYDQDPGDFVYEPGVSAAPRLFESTKYETRKLGEKAKKLVDVLTRDHDLYNQSLSCRSGDRSNFVSLAEQICRRAGVTYLNNDSRRKAVKRALDAVRDARTITDLSICPDW